MVQQDAVTSYFQTTGGAGKSDTKMFRFIVVLQGICGHADVVTILTFVRVFLMDMAEVTFQIMLVPRSEVTTVHRADVSPVAVLRLHMPPQSLNCIGLVITLGTLLLNLHVS